MPTKDCNQSAEAEHKLHQNNNKNNNLKLIDKTKKHNPDTHSIPTNDCFAFNISNNSYHSCHAPHFYVLNFSILYGNYNLPTESSIFRDTSK